MQFHIFIELRQPDLGPSRDDLPGQQQRQDLEHVGDAGQRFCAAAVEAVGAGVSSPPQAANDNSNNENTDTSRHTFSIQDLIH